MKKLTLSNFARKKLENGCLLLDEKDFPHLEDKDQVVELVSDSGHFLASAYLSKQNKGIGWAVTPYRQDFDKEFFKDLFTRARERRAHYEHSEQITAYRVFNQEGDGFGGLVVDLYGEYAVFSWYNSYVYSIKEKIFSAFREVWSDILGAYEKIRFKGLDYESAHVFGQEASETFLILENGVSYQVFLNDGLMTGIFLDQHEVRGSLVDGLASGKTLLNMFSYTAAFSVAAAMGGASQTVSVDLAKRSRELSQAHFKANGLELDSHQFVVMDVFEYFKYAKRKHLKFDVIVLDPPSFARNKKQTFSVVKDYHKIVEQAAELLTANGLIIASTNASNLSPEKFKKQIEKGLLGRRFSYEKEYRLPSDFNYNKNDESSNYLKVFTIRVTE